MTDPVASARAPSNIALIKYMGKKDAASNLPAHGSLSMTLDRLCSIAQVRLCNDGRAAVEVSSEPPEVASSAPSALTCPPLSDAGRRKVALHLERVRRFVGERYGAFGLKAHEFAASASIQSRCGNTFPAGAGIASSASSFASVTLAAACAFSADRDVFERAWNDSAEFRSAISGLSREGSGSSCRSLEGPWTVWETEFAAPTPSGLPEMSDLVVVVDSGHKSVSSSEAHLRVTDSPLWHGRAARAGARLEELRKALAQGDLHRVAWHAWMESWEMHSLFHTCADPFTYWKPGTIEVLDWIAHFVKPARTHGRDGRAPAFEPSPIVTLDAGPNLHVIVPSTDAASWRQRIEERFPRLSVLEDRQGIGAELVE